METSRPYPISHQHLLYPMLWIGALAVVVFSIVGIASLTGWMPQVLESGTSGMATIREPAPLPDTGKSTTETPKSVPAFQCVECGVIDSVRDIERRSRLGGAPVAAVSDLQKAAAAL